MLNKKGKKMKKEKLDTTTTQDLFKVDNCPACDGEGSFLAKEPDKYDNSEIYEDCDICKGSGLV